MSHQDQILKAFQDSAAARLSVQQLVEMTGLLRDQVTSATYQLINKEIGFNRAVVGGKERKGLFEYHAPGSNPATRPAPKVVQREAVKYLALRVLAELNDGYTLALDESNNRVYRLELI